MNKTKKLVYGAVLGALYAVLTLAFAPISYGPVQFRISEALTALPLLFDFAVPGLTVGCVVANLVGSVGIYDVIFGSLATLLGALGTRLLRKKPVLAMLVPVLSNALIVGSMLFFIVPDSPALLYNILTVGAGELVICLGMGLPLYYVLKKRSDIFRL
ncbi:MAG: QueT transporter family protein [Ruminococcaceae bacterium]|nr:QueT transporter family protein [Oscillospiraceae bacterium]